MLNDKNIHVDLAVSNLINSKKFYEETLGLTKIKEWDNEVFYQSGSSNFKIYQSHFAGTNQATYASWDVDDVDGVVKELKAKGVTFEHYDIPGVTHEGDVHIWGKIRSAWFKDPDGNILCLGNNAKVN